MKNVARTLALATLALFPLTAIAAPINPAAIPPGYAGREAGASPIVKANLLKLRQQLVAQHATFQVSYTGATDRNIDNLCGTRPVPNGAQFFSQHEIISNELANLLANETSIWKTKNPGKIFPVFQTQCLATDSSYDFRTENAVTPIKDQGYCGSCWDFGTIAGLESSMLLINKANVSGSEQEVLSCANCGTCNEGYAEYALEYLVAHGAATEQQIPYEDMSGNFNATANELATWPGDPAPYHLANWGVVSNSSDSPNPSIIKQALQAHGPLVVDMYAGDAAFQNYAGGVFNDTATNGIDHTIELIGWDDSKQAYLIKNSWGTDWGDTCGYGTERGFMWIGYHCNRIASIAFWVQAAPYVVPFAPLQILPIYKFNLPIKFQ